MEEEELELSLLCNLADVEIGGPQKRPQCNRCLRPSTVCWCKSINSIKTSCKVVIIQHPHEEKRCLRTAPILEAALPPQSYIKVRAKRFSQHRHPELWKLISSPNSIVMYPGPNATKLEDLPKIGPNQATYNIILIDGTWHQAKSMYYNSAKLKTVQQVCLGEEYQSEYVIRTQPSQSALSTVETAAIALATLEDNWSLYSSLVEPLKALCQFQISHGAVPHDSKEYMIITGKYKKPLGKRTYKKTSQMWSKTR